MFSIFAVVIGGIFSTVLYTGRRWFSFSLQNMWLLITIIVGVIIFAICLVYVAEVNNEKNNLVSEVTVLRTVNNSLERQLQGSMLLPDTGTTLMDDIRLPREFYGDTILLYNETESFWLEIDFNRIEKSTGVYTHYTFLNGNISGDLVENYDSHFSTSSELEANQFVREIANQIAVDLSPRDTYFGSILIDDEILSFAVSGLMGDFVIRQKPTYMQHQSVGEAQVSYRGKEFTANVLVENTYSVDHNKQLFFPGFEDVDSTTHQFVLWDEFGGFYLIDMTEVRSNTPEYPSHIWLVHKNAQDNKTQKSFEATLETVISAKGETSWLVTAPEFDGAQFFLEPIVQLEQEAVERTRVHIQGTVSDSLGIRLIGGILHIVE
jgi:hypothetical protein